MHSGDIGQSYIHVDKQRQKIWKENDKAAMQMKDHMFLKAERGVKRERERLKMREGGREGEGKRRENENEKLAK